MNDVNAPLDWLHEECWIARNEIRQAFGRVHDQVSRWEPAECPPRLEPPTPTL